MKGAVTYSSAFAVPSAWRGLTCLFGMGRGGAPALLPPEWGLLPAAVPAPFKVKKEPGSCVFYSGPEGVSDTGGCKCCGFTRVADGIAVCNCAVARGFSVFRDNGFVLGALKPGKGLGD